jgi:hypothetical protein
MKALVQFPRSHSLLSCPLSWAPCGMRIRYE